jgi:hypothetical protein
MIGMIKSGLQIIIVNDLDCKSESADSGKFVIKIK